MYLKVRLHADNPRITRDSVRSFFVHFPGLVFVVCETEAARPHFQGIVWSELTESGFRNKLRSWFKVTSNAQYSVGKVKDFDAHTRYLCKGPTKARGDYPDVVVMQAISFDVRAKHNQFWDENEQLKKRARSEGSSGLIDEVIQRVKGSDLSGGRGRLNCAQMVVEVLLERKRVINLFHVRGVVNAVMCQISSEYRSGFLDEIVSHY